MEFQHIYNDFPALFLEESYSWDNFKWAYVHVSLRNFTISLFKYKTLIPLCNYFAIDNTRTKLA